MERALPKSKPPGPAATAFDGEGTRRYGGRWNSPATRLVSTSGTQALAALELPSVIIRSEPNFLLNPAHPDFPRLTFGTPIPFAFDPRLLFRE